MAWEKGQEGAAAIGELAEAWLQAVGWIHAMSEAERLELARRTAYMHLIAAAAAAAPASTSLQSMPVRQPDAEVRGLLLDRTADAMNQLKDTWAKLVAYRCKMASAEPPTEIETTIERTIGALQGLRRMLASE